jgi:hypothetical protein
MPSDEVRRLHSDAYLEVKQDGVQRLRYENLENAGVMGLKNVPIEAIAITHAGKPVPRLIRSQDKYFNDGDEVIFFATSLPLPAFAGDKVGNLYSQIAVYEIAQQPEKVIAVADEIALNVRAQPIVVERAVQSIRFEQNNLYTLSAPNGDPFVQLRAVAAGGAALASTDFRVRGLNTLPKSARLKLELHGGVDHPGAEPDHHVQILLNDQLIGSTRFDGVELHLLELDPGFALREGVNTLSLRLPLDTGFISDVVFLEQIELSADLALSVEDRMLDQRVRAERSGLLELTIRGLASNGVVWIEQAGRYSSYVPQKTTQSVQAYITGDYRLLAAGNQQFVPSVRAKRDPIVFSKLFDYLVIAPDELRPDADAFAAWKTQSGLKTTVVSTQSIYDQYRNGEAHVDAIRAAIANAHENAGIRYVLLIGGDTTDARGHLNTLSSSLVPTDYVRTHNYIAFTPSDQSLAPKGVAIGRVPVRNAQEFRRWMQKAMRAQTTAATSFATFGSDRNEAGADYAAASRVLADVAGDLNKTQFVSLDELEVTLARQQLLDGIGRGDRIVHWFGHSSPARWSTLNAINVSAIQQATWNTARPGLVMQWGCWASYFVEPTRNTLGHALTLHDNGAAAVIGTSTLTQTVHDELLARKVLAALHDGLPLGDALQRGRVELIAENPTMIDVYWGTQLLGDPSAHW